MSCLLAPLAAFADPAPPDPEASPPPSCTPANTVTARVVALDQPFWLNRLGASQPAGMVFALERDVVRKDASQPLGAGNAKLRDGKRPRPLVLRANVGDCVEVRFTNLLAPSAPPGQLQTREAGVHVMGVPLLGSILSDGSFVGLNPSGLPAPLGGTVPPGGQITYRFFAPAEGTFLLYSTADDVSGGLGGQLTAGLFGAFTVQPRGAEWYRSQVTREDLLLATRRDASGQPLRTPGGQPILDFAKTYPAGASWPEGTPIPGGMPVLAMLDANRELVYGDLTAMITGPNHGEFKPRPGDPAFRDNPVEPNRKQPYRELTVLYHEMFTAVQAFPEFAQGVGANPDPTKIGPTIANGGEAFAINYGTAGIAAEILANRLGVGPMGRCVDCKFEEFFLSSWSVGDPAMVVDVPANNPCTQTELENGTPCATAGERIPATGTPFRIEPVVKATRAIYPDDPSNVYHSYLNDHVRLRVIHAGSFIAHVHHLHAHQWLHTPSSDNSTYLDSQMITPGTAYTLEIAFGGSGNLNKTAGDSIFHCHFYPHFAGGMWALWRVHDVFEEGTLLVDGKPAPGSRALPDGEIANGTPIPAIVPIPTLAMAPMPARVRIVEATDPALPGRVYGYVAEVDAGDLAAGKPAGYPFFVPGVAGHRAPHPPMDFAPNPDHAGNPSARPLLDGGLARHIVLDGDVSNEHHNQWDWSKDTGMLVVRELPEAGTAVERATMAYHSTPKPWVPSWTPSGAPGFFEVNGLPGLPGAPFANPGRDLAGNAVGKPRRYQGADIQTDVVFSKKGWHYPQQRHITLWEDVAATVDGRRPPEPLFMRANSRTDLVEYWMTNLVPGYYELDDFQVRTPTDILGQHIHLVKFDVLASDGATNGFNYEDGSLSPDEVRARIAGIRLANHCTPGDARDGSFACPVPQPALPVFGTPPAGQDWTGAQTTVQLWYADPVLNNRGDDRTLRTVFTHDHFGPSTHQQAGLYAGLLVEPEGSTWRIPAVVSYDAQGQRHVATDVPMATRPDGGPTSWQADVLTREAAQSYREFALEYQDTSLAYTAASPSRAIPYPQDGVYPLDAAGNVTPQTPKWGWADCVHAINPILNGPTQCPTGAGQLAAWPAIITGGPGTGTAVTNYRTEPPPLRVAPSSVKGTAEALDLSHVYRSIPRHDPELNRQPYGPIAAGSPFLFPGGFLGADDFDPYTPLLRAYQGDRVQLRLLAGAHVAPHFFTTHGLRWLFEPSEPDSGYMATQGTGLSEHFELLFQVPRTAPTEHGFADYLYVSGAGQADLVQGMWGLFRAYDPSKPQEGLPLLPRSAPPPPVACPPGAEERAFDVTAVSAAKALALTGGNVVYNSRLAAGSAPATTLVQPDGLLYVRTADLDASGRLEPGVPIEPLVLRANAGTCLKVTLRNGLDPAQLDSAGNPIFTTPLAQPMGDLGDSVNLYPSTQVGMRPQLVGFDVTRDGAYNVGRNPVQTVPYGGSRTYTWYAGVGGKPAELGFGNLLPSDPLMQDPLGLFGGLVIEPAGSTVREDASSRAAATVHPPGRRPFRELVLFTQSDILSIQSGAYASGLPWTAGGSSSSTANALNYRSEPIAYRTANPGGDISAVLTNGAVGGDPQTPVFVAAKRQPVRLRLGQVNGTGDAENLTIHGHGWQEEPFRAGSTELGDNPLSQWFGIVPHGPENHVNVLLGPAGGPGGVTGDYLYRSFFSQGNFDNGEWGLLRVLEPGLDSVAPGRIGPCAGNQDVTCVAGTNTVNPQSGKFAERNQIYEGSGTGGRLLGAAPVDPATGSWSFAFPGATPAEVTVRSDFGATAMAAAAQPEPVAAARALAEPPRSAAEEARVLRAQSFRKHRGPGGPATSPEPQKPPQR